jgi:hypothetical protein
MSFWDSFTRFFTQPQKSFNFLIDLASLNPAHALKDLDKTDNSRGLSSAWAPQMPQMDQLLNQEDLQRKRAQRANRASLNLTGGMQSNPSLTLSNLWGM